MGDLNKVEFLNWLKAILGLSYLKRAIVESVIIEMKTYYDKLRKERLTCKTFKTCTSELPCTECLKLMEKKLFINNRFKGKPFKQKQLIRCCKHYWEIAKCYSNSDDDSCSKGPESTDCAGVLNIIINAKNVTQALGIEHTIGIIDGKTDPISEVNIRVFVYVHLYLYLWKFVSLSDCYKNSHRNL